MHLLPTHARVGILGMLVEGLSMRSTARLMGVSINTVSKLLVDAGRACADFHDTYVRGIRSRRVECDEIWCYAYAPQRNVSQIRGNPEWAGDVWTWTALDPDTKLMVSWLVGDRSQSSADEFMLDLRARIEGRVQITTDGHHPYISAIESSFGADADYARIIKMFVPHPEEDSRVMSVSEIVSGSPDERFISTSLVERMNRSMRMGMKRYARRTDAFSKKIENPPSRPSSLLHLVQLRPASHVSGDYARRTCGAGRETPEHGMDTGDGGG